MKYVGVSTPAWSLTGDKDRGKFKDFPTHEYPGPGQYHRDASSEKKPLFKNTPAWRYPESEREKKRKRGDFLVNKNKFPGPGTYKVLKKKSQSQKILANNETAPFIAKQKRFRKKKGNETVGPGSYNDRKLGKSLPRYSLGYKFTDPIPRNSQKVGPGLYNPKHSLQEFSRTTTFGISKKKGTDEMRITCAPGPGKYFVPDSKKSYTSRKGTFGSKSASRFKKIQSSTPGVGSYNLNNNTIESWINTKKSRAAPFDGTTSTKDGNDVPGPGSYNPSIRATKRKGPSYTMIMHRRLRSKVDTSTPGPDKYQNVAPVKAKARDKDKQLFFGSSKRRPLILNRGTPGPVPSEKEECKPEWWRTNSAPKFSFKGRRGNKFKRNDFRFPGPGEYYTAHNFMMGTGGPEHMVGMSRRWKHVKSKDVTPGPGEYEISLGLLKNGRKFEKSKRRGPEFVDPEIEVGPATYDIKGTVPQLQPWVDKAQKEAGFKIALD